MQRLYFDMLAVQSPSQDRIQIDRHGTVQKLRPVHTGIAMDYRGYSLKLSFNFFLTGRFSRVT